MTWRDELVAAGLLIPAGADGLYGRSAAFEAVVSGLERVLRRAGADQAASEVRYPPVCARWVFERTAYLRSFPQLTGSVHTFAGSSRDHEELLGRLDRHEDWTGLLTAADTVLCTAACHPLYPTLQGVSLPPGGGRWDVYGYVFRHEPSADPARMQAFRQYEFVYVGEDAGALGHRDVWRPRALDLLAGLGLEVRAEVGSDPFFGRAGRLLADSQRREQLKIEVHGATGPDADDTALASVNCHRDHFGQAFGIRAADGSTAHSACVGFGVERVTLALLHAHGLQPGRWPPDVLDQLGLSGRH